MNKYWFRKRKGLFTKDLGWGWTPISYEGWICVLLYVLGIVYIAYDLTGFNNDLTRQHLPRFFISLILLFVVFLGVAIQKTKPDYEIKHIKEVKE